MPNSGPRNAALLAAWRGQIEGYIAFLEKLPSADAPLAAPADLWRKGMREHYMKLVARLMLDPPPGAERYIRALRSRLRRV